MTKKYVTILLMSSMILSLTACAGRANTQNVSENQTPVMTVAYNDGNTEEAKTLGMIKGVAQPKNTEKDPLYVADASIYRGVMEDVAVGTNGKTVWILRQADGTDFGSPVLNVEVDKNTKYSFNTKEVGNGAYLEVYYGGRNADGSAVAVAINRLDDPAMILYNGTVAEIEPDPAKKGYGYILLDPIEQQGMPYRFNYSPETRFYLSENQIKKGTKLNIMHSMASTRSIPPQSAALEIRTYVKSEALNPAIQLG